MMTWLLPVLQAAMSSSNNKTAQAMASIWQNSAASMNKTNNK